MINATPIRPLDPTPNNTFASGQDTSPRPSITQTTDHATPPVAGNSEKPKTPKKKLPLKYLLGGLFLLLLLVGSGAGLYLMRMSQDVRQQAYGGCPAGSNPINSGTEAGACKCTVSGDVVEKNGTCGETDGVNCSSSGMKPVDTGKGCCSGLAVDSIGRCMAPAVTPTPTSGSFDCAKGGIVPAGGATCYYP